MAQTRMRRLQRGAEPYLFVLPAFLAFGFLVIYPLYTAVRLSLHEANLLSSGLGGDVFVGLANYRSLFEDPAFWSSLKVTVYYTVLGVAGSFGLALGIALLLHQRLHGRSFIRTAMLLPFVLPQVVGAYVWLLIFDPQYGPLNAVLVRLGAVQESNPVPWLSSTSVTLFAVAAVTIWRFFPVAMLMLLASMQSVPESLYEAAAIDGAGRWQRFRHVTWPGIRPVANLVLLLLIIWIFRHFGTIYAMTQGGPAGSTETITIKTYVEAFNNYDLGAASAVGVVSLVLSAAFSAAYLYVFVHRAKVAEG